jgi:hypothetical protein
MNIFWTSPSSGDFATPANWSSNPAVPGRFDIAKMTVSGTTVSSTTTTTVLGITTGAHTTFLVEGVFNASEGTPTGANLGTIDIANSASLDLGGAVDNIGTINLNASGSATVLSFAEPRWTAAAEFL